MNTQEQTPTPPPKFDPGAYPPDSLFHERRDVPERRAEAPADAPAVGERRVRKDRRRRIDPTTFEKQYTVEELEFMTAMQRFKVQSGKTFPSFGEVLGVARSLGYRKLVIPPVPVDAGLDPEDPDGDLDRPPADE